MDELFAGRRHKYGPSVVSERIEAPQGIKSISNTYSFTIVP